MKTIKKKTTNSKSPKSKATLVDREYIVEEIKGKRFYEGETQFFVKWEGFEAECSTWEPMQNLGKCIHLLAKYENDVYLRNLERSVDEKEHMKLNASQGIEVQNNGCSTPVKPQPGQEPKQKLRNDWKKKCLRLSDSSDDEPSPAFESITPPLLNQPKSRRQLLVSSASSSASCSSSASFSSSTSSSFASAQPTQPQSQPVLPTKQSPPQPVIPTKQSRSQLQPVLPTNKQKIKFGDILEAAKKHRKDSGKKLSTNTEKTRANYSLEDAEDCVFE
ncbi:chromobox protein homolog 2 isoform X2 [Drosophila obscura]|uniref:chromobox protein homolog 2 isoform X2 n=1 Tax=Drosophila obscura TaxID=7282 RepID=UPI001BB20A03|nr:chromobox protein homolog 2 isoform X2 [Drosophila obscura]